MVFRLKPDRTMLKPPIRDRPLQDQASYVDEGLLPSQSKYFESPRTARSQQHAKSSKHLNKKTKSLVSAKQPLPHTIVNDDRNRLSHSKSLGNRSGIRSYTTARSLNEISPQSDTESAASFDLESEKQVLSSARREKSTNVKRQNSSVAQSPTLNDFRNKIYMLEIELDNERKKTATEKELRSKALHEVKTRFESEKTAALKALEARIQVEKLEELNRLKECLETEKNKEIEALYANKDQDVFGMRVRLKEKSER